MKIIQVRGNNGTGKTTVVRGFVKKHDYAIITIEVSGREIECHKIQDTIVIGRYDKNECGGCDASIKTGDELKNVIAKIARTLKPKVIVFEGVMYGKTFSYSYEIFKFCKAIKAEYLGICLVPDFDTTLSRIYERNGGKEVNIEGLYGGWKSAIKSNKKLEKAKVPIVLLDTSVMNKEEMGRILEQYI